MPKIIPLRELNNASKVSKMCHEENGPIFVTKNGNSDMVILSSELYDSMQKSDYSKTLDSLMVNNSCRVAEAATLDAFLYNRDSMPLYSIAEIKKVLSPIFKKHDVKKATLFGSYVKGTATTRSDVDLLVETNLKGLAFYGLLEDITTALRFPVDLIEKREIEKGSDIEKEIEETGVTIFG